MTSDVESVDVYKEKSARPPIRLPRSSLQWNSLVCTDKLGVAGHHGKYQKTFFYRPFGPINSIESSISHEADVVTRSSDSWLRSGCCMHRTAQRQNLNFPH